MQRDHPNAAGVSDFTELSAEYRPTTNFTNGFRMQRRTFLQLIGTIPAFTIGSCALPQTDTSPNILWLMADDMGWRDVGCSGHPSIRTPNIDGLAADGLHFVDAYVTSPSCSPSRASLWTGKFAHSVGAEELNDPVPGDVLLLPELLRSKRGYYSGNVGKFHIGDNNARKFDYIRDGISDWRQFFADRPPDKPFFLTVGFRDPHRPYSPGIIEQPYTPDDVVVPRYLPDTGETREELALYYNEITRMDTEIGHILTYLREQDLERETIVLFFSDNGSPFPRAKTTVYDSGIRTPLIVHYPEHFGTGIRHGLVSLIDLFPTILDLLSVEIGDDLQGRSFAPLIHGTHQKIRDYVYAERNWHTTDDHIRAVRSLQYKYIWNAYPDEPLGHDMGITSSITARKMRELRDQGELTPEQRRIFQHPRPAEELYDVTRDPNEFYNLAEEPAYQEILKQYRNICRDWMEQSNDVSPSKRLPDTIDRETGEWLDTG